MSGVCVCDDGYIGDICDSKYVIVVIVVVIVVVVNTYTTIDLFLWNMEIQNTVLLIKENGIIIIQTRIKETISFIN